VTSGVYPGSAIVGFFGTVENDGPGIVIGAIHQNDAVAQAAQGDANTLFTTLMGLPTTATLPADLAGQVLVGGVYEFTGGAALNTGILTLNGQNNPNSFWDFKIASTLDTATGSSIILINGADPNRVFWAVGSSASLGASSVFQGTIVAQASISMLNAASITCGRAIALTGAVTMINNTVTVCVSGGDDNGGGSNDIPIDELGGEGVTGTEQTAFDASRLFGSTMLAQTVFPYLAVGAPGFGPGNNGPQGNGPDKYTPLKLGPSGSEPDLVVGPYRPLDWRTWAAGLGGSSSLDGDHGSGTLDTNVGGVAGGIDYRFNSTALLGVAGGYTDSDLSVNSLRTDGNVQGAHVGLYGVKTFGRIYFGGNDRIRPFRKRDRPGHRLRRE
jgi:hypothetical protein